MDKPPKKTKLRWNISIESQAASRIKNVQEGNPSKVLEESTQKIPVSEAVLQEGERNVTRGGEHNHTGEPDFEAVEVPPVDVDSEPE